LGLKVFAYSPFGEIVGLKAPVHCVLRRRRGGEDDFDFEYRDCTPEKDEDSVFFIPIPDLLTAEQWKVALERPHAMRLGTVIVNVAVSSDYPPYVDLVKMIDARDRMLGAADVEALTCYVIEDGEAWLLTKDGSRR
jgi:hypothetical protein